MNKNEHAQRLKILINDDWPQQCILVHKRIADIRYLIDFLGKNFSPMQKYAVEIETISGTALGFGDDVFSPDEQEILKKNVDDLRDILFKIL